MSCDIGALLRAELILQPSRHFIYITAHSPTLPSLYLRHSSFSKPSVASPTSQLILQPYFRFSYEQSSFSHLSVTSPTSQLILQPLFRFSSEHSSFSNLSVTSPTSQLIFLPFRRFTYVTAHSPTVASPTSQIILQPLRCFTYVTAHSPTLLSLLLRHSSFSNPSFASPTSQALHLRHLASRPWLSGTGFVCLGIP